MVGQPKPRLPLIQNWKMKFSHPCEGHPNCCWQQRKWHLEWCCILPLRQQFCHSQCLHAIHNPLQQFKLWTWKVVSKVLLSIYKPTLYVWVFFLKVNLSGATCHSCVIDSISYSITCTLLGSKLYLYMTLVGALCKLN